MKILQISSVPVWYSGGTEKVVLDLSRQLSKKHEVLVLQTNLYEEEEEKFKRRQEINGVNIITCKNDRFLGGFGYSKEFKRILKKIYKNFDVIHVHGHGRFTSDYALKFLKGKKPIIYTAHGFFHDDKNSKVKKIYDKTLGRKIKNASFCTALTKIEEKKYLSLGVKRNKIKIIPNFIDLNNFKAKKNKRRFCKKTGLDPKLKTILFVGRIHESKGLGYLVDSIKDLKVNLAIVGGDSGYKKILEQKIESLNLKNRIKFLGRQSDKDLAKSYANSDLFVLFSKWEGFGIVVLEAMASGLAVVGSNQGALPLLVKNNERGLIAKYPDAQDLKKKIKILLSNTRLRKRQVSNALRYSKKFSLKKVVEEYEKIYNKARQIVF